MIGSLARIGASIIARSQQSRRVASQGSVVKLRSGTTGPVIERWRGFVFFHTPCYQPGMLTGDDLRIARQNAGLLRRELGQKLGVNELTIRNVELGRVRDARVEARIREFLWLQPAPAVR